MKTRIFVPSTEVDNYYYGEDAHYNIDLSGKELLAILLALRGCKAEATLHDSFLSEMQRVSNFEDGYSDKIQQ